ncbi:hypothetical protein [Pseudomonas sp. S31]|uniref:hypothetical protein n=1 Tax=Pseudomonas sp. S31 TaxID=1564473 RepID=UPI001911C624|nr:hypothetical protein [Pseudomonas sp. S31]
MNTRNPVISLLVFPISPIAVIWLTHFLCREIWYAAYYVPGEDGGEAEPALALMVIPLLLIFSSLLLGGLTMLNSWGVLRWLTALGRVPITGLALLLSLVSTVFLMGEPQAVFRHWEVGLAWLAWLGSAGLFLIQQWDRLRN